MKTSKEGFTLVELSLAMVFISLLALAIVLIIMNTISSYRKGLTLNQINTTGSELVDDIRTAIQNSSSNSPNRECGARYESDSTEYNNCQTDGGQYLVSVVRYGNVRVSSGKDRYMPIFGAICTGSYSYIWNSGYGFSAGAERAEFTINDMYSTNSNFRLLKVRDEKRTICYSHIDTYPSSKDARLDISRTFSIPKDEVGNEEPVELLDLQSDLALYDLEMMAPAEAKNGASLYYTGSFILGTIQGGPDIMAANTGCQAPADSADSTFDYCAINKFNFAGRAGGE